MAESAGEKTEEPSHKKLQDARKKGQVAVSKDMTAGVVFSVVFSALSMTAGTWLSGLIVYYKTAFVLASRGGSPLPHLIRGLNAIADVVKAPLIGGMLGAIVIGFLQTGGNFTLDVLKVDPQRLMPNFKKLVSIKVLVEVIKGFVKVSLAAAVAWAAIRPLLGVLTNLTGLSAMGIMTILGYGVKKVGNNILLVVIVIGIADTLWQRHSHMKEMRMSREDLKNEHKQSEGDPHHKHERKRFHKELLEQRMVNEVKKANFVVVNPTHIAVAIKYDRDKDPAPTVLAKGERLLAERIKQAAKEAGVPIFRDVGLARALRDVEEGDEIPEALYEAVAELLRVVYDDGSSRGGVGPPGMPGAVGQGVGQGAAEAAAPAVTSDAPRGSWRRA